MNKRVYNILFHLHTVTSIVISVALFVIFFAGSFSFFRDEIVNWERGHAVESTNEITANVDSVLIHLDKSIDLYGRDISLNRYYNERRIGVSLSDCMDTTLVNTSEPGSFFYFDTSTKDQYSYQDSYSLGEFIYRLHFFAQIPYPIGYYLSGLVAVFFLMAIVTGLIVHWKKIISNFYQFRPWAKMKTVWTDSHTALGVIGLPFQFIYAVTGAFFMLKFLVVAPFVIALFNGDVESYDQTFSDEIPEYAFAYQKMEGRIDVNTFLLETRKKWKDFNVTSVDVFNYGDQNMHVSISGHLPEKTSFLSEGQLVFNAAEGSIVFEKSPFETLGYSAGVESAMMRLHFGDYAGVALKVVSFILGLITCFVILSGVMIWITARNKKNVPPKKLKFNKGVVLYYLAICLSMFPIVALEFILVKLFPSAGMSFIYITFFTAWLLLTIFFVLKKDNMFTVKWTLYSSCFLGILIPIVNGATSGNWLWISWKNDNQHVFTVDVLWLSIFLVLLLTIWKLRRGKPSEILKKIS